MSHPCSVNEPCSKNLARQESLCLQHLSWSNVLFTFEHITHFSVGLSWIVVTVRLVSLGKEGNFYLWLKCLVASGFPLKLP